MDRQPSSQAVEENLHPGRFKCTPAFYLPSLPLTISSKQPTLLDPERVLYAALAPSPATSAVLKSACRTWEDHLWAQISIMCEEKLTSEMGRLGGFWEGGVGAVEKGMVPMTRDEEEAEEEDWEKEATDALETLGGVGVIEGCVTAGVNLPEQN